MHSTENTHRYSEIVSGLTLASDRVASPRCWIVPPRGHKGDLPPHGATPWPSVLQRVHLDVVGHVPDPRSQRDISPLMSHVEWERWSRNSLDPHIPSQVGARQRVAVASRVVATSFFSWNACCMCWLFMFRHFANRQALDPRSSDANNRKHFGMGMLQSTVGARRMLGKWSKADGSQIVAPPKQSQIGPNMAAKGPASLRIIGRGCSRREKLLAT